MCQELSSYNVAALYRSGALTDENTYLNGVAISKRCARREMSSVYFVKYVQLSNADVLSLDTETSLFRICEIPT